MRNSSACLSLLSRRAWLYDPLMPEQSINSLYTDDVSPAARQILKIDVEAAYTRLVVHGGGNMKARAMLDGATPELMLSSIVQDKDDARAMLAGLWLWHDWLDESHRISQSL